MDIAGYVVSPIPGTRRSDKRAIAFLLCEEDDRVNSQETFECLETKKQRELRTSFDMWIDGKLHQDNRFHGWPNEPENKHCFVFKWKENKLRHRLYGFLCNPKPTNNRQFQLCVLVSHTTKSERATDPKQKALMNHMRKKREVARAVIYAFPDLPPGANVWTN